MRGLLRRQLQKLITSDLDRLKNLMKPRSRTADVRRRQLVTPAPASISDHRLAPP
jgi:hypothetical protein